jgi:phosphoribosyl 1,2-cyclic phosphate phosphodiesterase
MKLEVLGSGGAVTTPKPFCFCNSCLEAKNNGNLYSRLGPSVFIHGPDILIDTPEEIFVEINRSSISNIKACMYSHWHPDHTAGKRIFEINKDWNGYPAKNKDMKLILPEKLADTFNSYLGIMSNIKYMMSLGLIDLEIIDNKNKYKYGDYYIKPVMLAFDYVFGYIIEGEGKLILIVMDEMKNWEPSAEILGMKFDLVYLPFGIFDINPFTNQRLIDERHPILEDEQVIEETIDIIRELNSSKFVLSHIEEPDNITFGIGKELSRYYSKTTNKNIELAYDTMSIEV